MPALLTAAVAYCFLHTAVFVPAVRRKFPRLCAVALSLFLTVDSLLAGLLLLELYLAKVYDQSDGFNLTYAGKVWFERHWHPLNSLGYRDSEPLPPAGGQRSLVVLGDSFASGHGIKRPEDRFSDVAARLLGSGWRVYNVAKLGWDTVDETQALRSFPVKTDVVVLAYVLNDIYHAAAEEKYPLAFNVNLPRGFSKKLTENSALANFAYWRLARGGNLAGGAATFWDTLQGAYNDPAVWKRHMGEMADLVSLCKANGSELVVLVFPMMQAPRQSAGLTARVSEAFASLGATVVDLGPEYSGRNPSQLVVNAQDAHPNEAVHAEVGRRMVEELRQMGLLAAPAGQGKP